MQGGLIGVFADPLRDPRKHVISFAYSLQVHDLSTMKAQDDAIDVGFISIDDILSGKITLAFDHLEILNKFLQLRDQHRQNQE